MEASSTISAAGPSAYSLWVPVDQTAPVVFASPHSGRQYPEAFVTGSRLDFVSLRRSEDAFVDELFSCVPDHGAPLIAASYARAYCDLNREPYELDPSMFSGPLPKAANIKSPRVAAGLGTIARTVGSGMEIYRGKLSIDEIEKRLELCYRPYHRQLERLIAATHERFGWCLLVDCHSMPSSGVPIWRDRGVDMVLGDCHGLACGSDVTEKIENFLTEKGYRVAINTPYAGGFTTSHYGHPSVGFHSIQIEINRDLYLDEASINPGPGFNRLRTDMNEVVRTLTKWAAQWQVKAP